MYVLLCFLLFCSVLLSFPSRHSDLAYPVEFFGFVMLLKLLLVGTVFTHPCKSSGAEVWVEGGGFGNRVVYNECKVGRGRARALPPPQFLSFFISRRE